MEMQTPVTVTILLILLITLSIITNVQAQTIKLADIEFIISRFRESIDELCFLKDYKHIVYNRGDSTTISTTCQQSFHVEEVLENVGREGFVYLKHIVENYEKLPSALVFLQGDIKSLRKDLTSLFDTGEINMPAKNDGFAFLYSKCTSSRKKSHIAALNKRYGGTKVEELFKNGHQELLNVTISNPRYSGFGYFIVTREIILRRPKRFYIELARKIGAENDPYVGHFYERAWAEIFSSSCSMDPKHYYCSLNPNIVCK